jgi:hypothetical protein
MTQRRKRPFYIIGHNPNTIEEAEEYLRYGVNALEPDIIYHSQQFYVSHAHPVSYEQTPTLERYLQQLKELLASRRYNLALLIFDFKDNNFDINHFFSIVKENFCGNTCDGVAILATHADDHAFVSRYRGTYPNIGIGVDESNTPPSELEQFFKKAGQKNFTYADGITTFLSKPGVYKNIREAQWCRDKNEPDSFKLIYTWALHLDGSMHKYLDTCIDGIFVDPPSVKDLKELINHPPYNEVYDLAPNGYNPFTATPIPKYMLAVTTRDQLFSGTDARILFTLKNASGETLKSLPFNADLPHALERDTTTYLSIEGMDLGTIHSLTIEALTDDFNAAWLPEQITVESRWLDKKLTFIFNGDHLPEEWLTRKGGPIIRFPSEG